MDNFDLVSWLISNSSYDMPRTAEYIAKNAELSRSYTTEEMTAVLEELTDRALLLDIIVRKKDDGYYVELPFSEADIMILKAALMGIPYYEEFHQHAIIKRLDILIPEYMRESDSMIFHESKYNGSFYENVSEIIRALYPFDYSDRKRTRKLRFEYCVYDENKELVTTKIGKKHDIIAREANPLKIVCINNLFYLITFYNGYDGIKYINYRIDKMKNVVCLDKDADSYAEYLTDEERYYLSLKNKKIEDKKKAIREGKIYRGSGADIAAEDAARHIDRNGFNLGEYIHNNPTMYSDEIIDIIKIRSTDDCIGRIIDSFGFAPDIILTGKKCEKYNKEHKEIIATLHNIAKTGIMQFALQYYDEVEILEPTSLREKLHEAVEVLSKKYGGGNNE